MSQFKKSGWIVIATNDKYINKSEIGMREMGMAIAIDPESGYPYIPGDLQRVKLWEDEAKAITYAQVFGFIHAKATISLEIELQ